MVKYHTLSDEQTEDFGLFVYGKKRFNAIKKVGIEYDKSFSD